VSKFTLRRRGGQGVVAIHTTERNGELVAAVSATQSNDLLLISDMGTMVRTRVGEVSVMSRSAQGVTLIRLSNEEQLVGVVSLEAPEEERLLWLKLKQQQKLSVSKRIILHLPKKPKQCK
jgi:DNA gyrase subunit A